MSVEQLVIIDNGIDHVISNYRYNYRYKANKYVDLLGIIVSEMT